MLWYYKSCRIEDNTCIVVIHYIHRITIYFQPGASVRTRLTKHNSGNALQIRTLRQQVRITICHAHVLYFIPLWKRTVRITTSCTIELYLPFPTQHQKVSLLQNLINVKEETSKHSKILSLYMSTCKDPYAWFCRNWKYRSANLPVYNHSNWNVDVNFLVTRVIVKTPEVIPQSIWN